MYCMKQMNQQTKVTKRLRLADTGGGFVRNNLLSSLRLARFRFGNSIELRFNMPIQKQEIAKQIQ